jgi:hypothetical protein
MTALSRSILETEVLRSLQAAEDHWARANRKLVDGEQPPLPKLFFTAAEMDAVLEQHAAELEAIAPHPKPGGWLDQKRRMAEEKAKRSPYADFAAALAKARSARPSIDANIITVLDMVATALADDRFTIGILRDAVQPLLAAIPIGPRDVARQRHIETWLDMISGAWSEAPALSPAPLSDNVVELPRRGKESP